MKVSKKISLLLLFVFSIFLSRRVGAVPECDAAFVDSLNKVLEDDVSIKKAVLVNNGSSGTKYCDVQGIIEPEVGFTVYLPADKWNQKFYMVGNGGYAGSINDRDMKIGLEKGYAAASTDTGHVKTPPPDLALFAYNNKQKEIDYSYRAVHRTAVTAKEIIKAYYDIKPVYSYFTGCSTGGRQALMEAQRFPQDFDGIIVGAPVLDFSKTQIWSIWNAMALWEIAHIRIDQLEILADAIYSKCDGYDSVYDGVISDPEFCDFDPTDPSDLPRCPQNIGNSDCFTDDQVAALYRIYDGVRNSAGDLLFPGPPPGAEACGMVPPYLGGGIRSGWEKWMVDEKMGAPFPSLGLLFGKTFLQYMAFIPDVGPEYDWHNFDFDTDIQKMNWISKILDATDPDLSGLKKSGGKIIHYHGWADPALNPFMSVNYYKEVLKVMGDKKTKEFYRMFMVPGLFHCWGGVGPFKFDVFSALVEWVEKGIPPDWIHASDMAGRSRKLCPYPTKAVYMGKDPDNLGSFECIE